VTAAALTRGATAPPRSPDRPAGGPVMARLVWLRSARRRRRDLRRPLEPLERLGRQRLPGTSVDTELYEARDAYDRPFALLLAPATGHASLVLSLVPPADDLLDAEGAELWIADLGVWLAMLVHEPHLAGCAVSLLHDPHAGPAAGLVVTLQLTWRTRGPQGRTDAAALAVELGARLPHLVNGLRRCEAGTAAPLTAAEVARIVGSAYDPLGQGRPGPGPSGPGAAGTEALRVWPDAGPGEASEGWDRLRHDSATSLTWSLSEVRPDLVLSGVLAQLAAAHAEGRPEAARTRVTLLHRPAVGEPGVGVDRPARARPRPAGRLRPLRRAPGPDVPGDRLGDRPVRRPGPGGPGCAHRGLPVVATLDAAPVRDPGRRLRGGHPLRDAPRRPHRRPHDRSRERRVSGPDPEGRTSCC